MPLFFKKFFEEFQQYWGLIRDYWINRKSLKSWVFLLCSLGLSYLFVHFSLYMNELYGNIYDSVEQKDKVSVVNILKVYAYIFIFYLIAHALKHYLVSLVIFRWREFLSEKMVHDWLDKKKYHSIKKKVDNPDQRISEDIDSFCINILHMVFVIFTEGLTFIGFIWVIWSFPYSFDFSLFGYQFSISHYLAIGSFAYAILMNYILLRIGKPIVLLDYEKERKEADYRSTLIRINNHSEEIAFYGGEEVEKETVKERFSQIKANYLRLIKKTFTVTIFDYGYSMTLSILPIFASLPLYFADKISFGEMMKIASATGSVLVALGVLITHFQTLASLQAVKNRLVGFSRALKTVEEVHYLSASEKIIESEKEIKLSGITLLNSEDKPLMKELNLIFKLGKKSLIMGKSGIGKTSILRCLAKIWMPYSGKIHLPKENLYLVPQRPYLPLGTLERCLNYPYISTKEDNLLMMTEVLTKVGLSSLAECLKEEKDYLKILSLGELQRLNFAKILLHKPKIIVMDEPTSSLDARYELLMFDLLATHLPKETTIITVSHSKELANYHDHVITIGENEESLTL